MAVGLVGLADTYSVDGAGMRQWLGERDAFIAHSGDLPDELVADRERKALAVLGVHAKALVDAARLNDKAGKQEAYKAIIETIFARERALEQQQGLRRVTSEDVAR